jgi:WhiB family transcriptional regulator, redox-sensing transcriptional regulator
MQREGWRMRAACRGVSPDLFFADGPVGAKKVCSACPVAERCLAYAMADNIRYGVWGGLTDAERRIMAGKAP